MMEELSTLVDLLDLQAVDLEIDRLLHQRQSLPELDEYKAAHQRVDELTAETAAAEASSRETRLELDRTSGELELATAKLDSEQNRLYAGGMSARDADFLRQEVQMLERQKATMEDGVLELMEQSDQEERIHAEQVATRDGAAEEKAKLEALIQAAWAEIDAVLARKESRKADVAAMIPEDLMALYDELRPIKDGVAVGRLAEGVCGGCHLRLTPAEQLEAARSDPPRCLHCGRILVP